MHQANGIRIFISSPGDVAPERQRAIKVIEKVQTGLEERIKLTPISWEETYYTAETGFQPQIPPPSQTDLVLCILWKRLGSELPSQYDRPDGSHRTGTEWEFEDALQSAVKREVPDILVYRKTAPVTFAAERVDAEQADFHHLEDFWKKWFHNEQGHFTAGFQYFQDTDEFEILFEKHLRQWLADRSGDIIWPVAINGSPFRGLEPYDEAHAPVFYGRRRAVEEAKARLVTCAVGGCAFLLITGMSGSGKSSLARAGLGPRLQRLGAAPGVDRWRRAVMRPAAHPGGPLLSLAEALFQEGALPELAAGDCAGPTELAACVVESPSQAVRSVGRALDRVASAIRAAEGFERDVAVRLLLIVDQLEELLQAPPAERDAFAALLGALCLEGRVWGVATLRSDYYQQFKEVPGIWELKDRGGQYPLSPPGPAEIREIIQGPAQAAGLSFEVDLESGESLDAILERGATGPGYLPLLQFTLERLFELRDKQKKLLLLSAYRALGGIEGSISAHADAIFESLDAKAQEALPRVLLHLVTVRPDNPESLLSRPVALVMFGEDSAERRLIAALVAPEARLLVSDGEGQAVTVRVAHEALLSYWDKAKAVIEAARPALAAQARLTQGAAVWAGEGKRADLLWGSVQLLRDTQELLRQHELALAPGEREFLDKSLARTRRNVWVKRTAVTALAVLTIISLIQYRRAELSQREARAKLAEIYTRDGHKAREVQAWGRSLLYYATSLEAQDNYGSRIGAADALAHNVNELAILRGHERYVSSVAFSPDGETIASGAHDKTVRLWDRHSGKELAVLRGHESFIFSVAFSPDGETIASGAEDKTVRLWDRATSKILAVLRGHEGAVLSVAFSPDGTIIASGAKDKTVRLWDRTSGRQLTVLSGHNGTVESVAFSPDGAAIASGAEDKTVRLWDWTSGKVLAVLRGHDGAVLSVTFSRDGSTIASGAYDDTVRLWDRDSGKQMGILWGHDGAVRSVAFSPDGMTIASGAEDKTIRLWDQGSGRQLAVLSGHEDYVLSVAFSPGGATIASGACDKTVRLWDWPNGRQLVVLRGHKGTVESVAFSPDGMTIASGAEDKTVRLWDRGSGRQLAVLSGHESFIHSVAFSPDGTTIASGAADNTVRLWDRGSGRQLAVLKGHNTGRSVAFSPDGKTIASGDYVNTMRLWDRASGRQLAILSGHAYGDVTSVAFSPDGKTIASGAADKTVRLWDRTSGRQLTVLSGHDIGVTSVAFSPDGSTIASGAYDNTVRLWGGASGRQMGILRGHDGPVTSVSFSPDGATIASGGYDNTVRIWDRGSGRQLAVLEGHNGTVESVAFSPDGETIASGAEDQTVRLWDLGRGKDFLNRLAVATSAGISYTLDNNGQLLSKNPVALARARLEAARAGRIWWRKDGGRSLTPLYENELAQAEANGVTTPISTK